MDKAQFNNALPRAKTGFIHIMQADWVDQPLKSVAKLIVGLVYWINIIMSTSNDANASHLTLAKLNEVGD